MLVMATLPATVSVPVRASGRRSFLETELGLDLAGRLGGLDGLAGGDRLDHPQHLDGVVTLVSAGVGAAHVQEHQQRADGGDDGGDEKQNFPAIHER